MQSAKSFFNVALFKKNTLRFWPIWILYTLVMVITLPLYALMHYSREIGWLGSDIATDFHNHIMRLAAESTPSISVIIGVVVASAMWSYLHNSRASALIHSLPMNRTSLFTTNYLTGLLFFLVPNVVVFLLTYFVGLSFGVTSMSALLTWLYCQSMISVFFYSFATLLAFVTGNVLVLPVLYGIFNALAEILYQMMNWLIGEFVYGYAWDSMYTLREVTKYLTPMHAIETGLDYTYPEAGQRIAEIQGLTMVAVYALVGVLFVGLAYLLYRRRKLELAGEVIAEPFLKPVFRVGFAVCAGLSLTSFFYAIFQDVFRQNFVGFMLILLLWSAICYIAGDMILNKSVKLRRGSLKSCAVLLAVLALCGLAIEADIFGYEKTVPEADQVVEIIIGENYYNDNIFTAGMTEEERAQIITQTIALHETLIAEKDRIERMIKGKDPEMLQLQRDNYVNGWETWDWETTEILYELANGQEIKRRYSVPVTESLLDEDSSSVSMFDALINSPTAMLSRHFPYKDDIQRVNASVSLISGTGEDADHWTQTLSNAASQQLYEAVLEDIKNGRIGVEHLLRTEENQSINYENMIYFDCIGEYNVEYLRGHDIHSWGMDDGEYTTEISLQSTATATLETLRSLGIEDEFFQSSAEYIKYEMLREKSYEETW